MISAAACESIYNRAIAERERLALEWAVAKWRDIILPDIVSAAHRGHSGLFIDALYSKRLSPAYTPGLCELNAIKQFAEGHGFRCITKSDGIWITFLSDKPAESGK